MRNLDGAAADEFADHRIAGDDVAASDLLPAEALDRIQQMLHPVITDAGVQEAGVGLKILRRGADTPPGRRRTA